MAVIESRIWLLKFVTDFQGLNEMFFILTDIMHSVCGQFFILTHDSGIFVKFCQILSSQTSGISKNFFDFYPHMDSGSYQYFRGS